MDRKTFTLTFIMTAIVMVYVLSGYVTALPTGATISNPTTAGTPNPTPANRSDAHGTITTMILSSTQQDQSWKGYVGNISGVLALDDAAGNALYSWPLTVTKNGRVLLTRAPSPIWTNVSCAGTTNITSEQTFFGMGGSAVDNINATFNYTTHSAFTVGTITIGANTCKSTATYRGGLIQNMTSPNTMFQEVLLQDNVSDLIYASMINSSTTGFDNRTYDYQIIVPDFSNASIATYYFYTELTG